MPKKMLFTSESVTEGHPDKMADQISDAILDAIIREDKNCRVACETLIKTGMTVVAGEITTNAKIDFPDVIRTTIEGIGYTSSEMGFDAKSSAVLVALDKQSPDIAMGVDRKNKEDQGAGDQGLMFGFACNESPELMPLPIFLAHNLTLELSKARKEKRLKFLRPDGKSQVTIEYVDGKPVRVDAVVISSQHAPDITHKKIEEGIIKEVVKKVIPASMLDKKTKFHINPTGQFIIGGPMGDCGLTGRKIIVDTYGGYARHGGGAFSGKDPSKVDRSAAYFARYVAKNIVAAGLADKVEIQVAYAIGVARPVSILVDTFGTAKLPEAQIEKIITEHFDFRPAFITESLNLLRPIYQDTAAYGHFGRSQFPWEKTDKAKELKKYLKK